MVDDAVAYRKIVSEILGQVPGVDVVGSAANGKIALDKIERLRPDLLTLDLEMPELNGQGVLQHLEQAKSDVGAIILSSLTQASAAATISSLRIKAFDFVLKPSGPDARENAAQLKRELTLRLKAFAAWWQVHQTLRREPSPTQPEITNCSIQKDAENTILIPRSKPPSRTRPEVIALGISTGGPQALNQMLPLLPADLPVPMLIVQHMPPLFTQSLADDLNARCQLEVLQAEEGQLIQAGQILIAPGGKQMKIKVGSDGTAIRLTEDPPENACRPSVDYLFRSVAEVYYDKALGIIMTGMGSDGTRGCRLLKSHGSSIIAQDEKSCTVFGMPSGPIQEGLADIVASPCSIAKEIVAFMGREVSPCS